MEEIRYTFEKWDLSQKTPRGVANEIKRRLEKDFRCGDVKVWNPKKSKEMGYGDFWAVVSEDAPFEWTVTLTGWNSSLADNEQVFAEPQNGWMLCLTKE